MRAAARAFRAIIVGSVTALTMWQIAAVPAIADTEFNRQQAVWTDFKNLDKAVAVPAKTFQEMWGNPESNKLLEDYADAILIISISRELRYTADLQAAGKLIDGKLGDLALKRLAPRFHYWFGWFSFYPQTELYGVDGG